MCQLNVSTVTPHESTQRISRIKTASINIESVPEADGLAMQQYPHYCATNIKRDHEIFSKAIVIVPNNVLFTSFGSRLATQYNYSFRRLTEYAQYHLRYPLLTPVQFDIDHPVTGPLTMPYQLQILFSVGWHQKKKSKVWLRKQF